ncbi:phosphatase phospho-type [Umbelopsis sp. PMI_123]|nr:phosphatase phospho-type [Umbelopsis sp. PMI_123]
MAPTRDPTLQNLAVFDFDWSMIEQDSDDWTLTTLSPETYDWVRERKETQWTDLMGQALTQLHDKGFTPNDIQLALEQIPFHPAMKEVLQRLSGNNTTVLIISDANTVFIESILKANGVRQYVHKIITNPAKFDNEGRLIINRLISKNSKPHGCSNGCALNICKGLELTKYLEEHGPFQKIMYVGDGANDYCPSTQLHGGDKVFVRKGKALEALLKNQPDRVQSIKCDVQYWNGPQEILDSVIQDNW